MNDRPIQKYRGTRPAVLIRVLEGDGKETPYREVDYVLDGSEVGGLGRFITLGKVDPITEEERSWFSPPTH